MDNLARKSNMVIKLQESEREERTMVNQYSPAEVVTVQISGLRYLQERSAGSKNGCCRLYVVIQLCFSTSPYLVQDRVV